MPGSVRPGGAPGRAAEEPRRNASECAAAPRACFETSCGTASLGTTDEAFGARESVTDSAEALFKEALNLVDTDALLRLGVAIAHRDRLGGE